MESGGNQVVWAPVCRVGEECARRARAEEEEDRLAQESKSDPSSNASVRSHGFSLAWRFVAVVSRENQHPRDRYHSITCIIS